MSRSVPLWTSLKNWAIHHRRVVGASSCKTSNTNAVYTKEKWYIKNHIRSATAEWKYMEGCNTFPRSRCNTSWYSVSYVQIQIGYDRSLWANTHKTRGCRKNNILYNIWHVSEPSNANGGLQCTLHISAVNDCYIPRFPWKIRVYLDDIFIYSQSIWEHIEHIMKVLQRLRESQFYLSRSKLDLFSDKTDCLGHVINDNGIHAELDKMQQIREWRIAQNYNEVQKFLELVQYLALYMPDIMAYTTLLSGSAQNNRTFQWTPLLDKCFQSIKAIATYIKAGRL